MAAPSTPVAGTPFFDLDKSHDAPARPALDIFYPIVPDAAWLERLVPLGVKTIQLRLKDAAADVVRREIAASLEICARHGCQLIVNDYWREAIELGADYIHLGQEDLAGADVAAIKSQGRAARHQHAQPRGTGDRARCKPDYVALGPIYETKLKVMKWAPQGLDRIARLEAPHRRPAADRHWRHHAGTGRWRGGRRRRQRCRDYRFLHPRRSGSPGPPMAGMGRALQSLRFPAARTVPS